MKRLLAAALVVAVVAVAALAQAQDTEKAAKKKGRTRPNPTGTWTWTVTFGDQKRDMTLKLKLDADKLTGVMVGRDGTETKIQDAKYQKGELSFTVVRVRNEQKMISKYTGKVSEDAIKGKMEFGPEGQTQSRDWEAKRVKETKEKPPGEKKGLDGHRSPWDALSKSSYPGSSLGRQLYCHPYESL